MYLLRKILYFFLNIVNRFILIINKAQGHPQTINGLIHVVNKGNLIFEKGVRINSGAWANPIGGDTRTRFIVRTNAKLVLGKNVGISNSTIYCMDNIIIGDNTLIGGSCRIWDSDFHSIDPTQRLKNHNEGYKTKPIFIGNNVFIGGGSIILKGVSIGDNSVVGAGSVVRTDIPANQIWAGNPAVYIKDLK